MVFCAGIAVAALLAWRGAERKARAAGREHVREQAEAAARQKAELAEQAARLQAIFDRMIEGMLVLDGQGRITLANRAAGEFFHFALPATGRTLIEVARHHEIAALRTRLESEPAILGYELRLEGLPPRILRVNAVALRDPAGAPAGALLVFHDLTRLRELEGVRQDFVANVSHELRTPLNSILGFAELLRDTSGDKADPRSTRYLQNILNSGRNLLELINDLLDLAKIEAGRMEVRSAPLPLNDLFEGLTGILKPLSEKKNLTIVTGIAGDVPILQTDAAKLQQVLYNFLSNAIKFSPAAGQIDLSAERVEEGRVRISVTDRGPGIDADKQQMIFEKFRQIDGSVTREHGGTGLGLAISKELIGLMGGEIGVRSAPGAGATFWIVLPVRIEAGALDVRGGLVLT